MNVESLEPKECFTWFAELAKIPRGSHNEKGVSDFLVAFAQKRGLDVNQDKLCNVCIKKPGTKGYEKAPAVILQGHMDMVCVKEQGLDFDFLKDPINLVVRGDTLSADRTTLGADNGIALAFILAILDSADVPHPPLEAVITVAEEVGMSGAAGFDVSQLAGTGFINIDSEEEGIFCVSCAGGRRSKVALPVEEIATAAIDGHARHAFFSIALSGLAGGHSGMQIDKQRGNAIRLMGRTLDLLAEKHGLYLAGIRGGSATNVIPAECEATVFIKGDQDAVKADLDAICAMFRNELKASDGEGLKISFAPATKTDVVWSGETLRKVVIAASLIPDGFQSMDLNITDQKLVECSSNLGVIETTDEGVVFSSLTRSSVGSKKEFVYRQIAMVGEVVGAEVSYFGDYPAWEFNPDSRLREVFLDAYKALYTKDAKVEGIHAGLECGIFYEKFREQGRDMDFIAFGPDISGAHTVKEAVSISSVARTWELFKEVLKGLGTTR